MPSNKQKKPINIPQQQPHQPGDEHKMTPQPDAMPLPKNKKKLEGKVAVITGGDSGIGRAVAILFAQEGADVAIVYLNEHEDAKKTATLIEEKGQRCLCLAGDVSEEVFCVQVIRQVIERLGQVDILVNNAAEQHPTSDIKDITTEQLQKTFATNIFAYFYMVKAVLPYFKSGCVIINTTSVTAYRGSPHLLDYSATKGAIVSFTRSLSQSLASQNIRVNAVAPGPVWTPLIPATFPKEEVATFGSDVPLGRPAQPMEIAPSFLFLASEDSSYMTGQVLHPNGGEVING